MIIGIDEVGRGPIAGPLVVCGSSFPSNFPQEIVERLCDSKKLSLKVRTELSQALRDNGLRYVLAESSAQEIDKYGMAYCLKDCVKRIEDEFVLTYPEKKRWFILDGSANYLSQPGETMVKADSKIHECMASSIIAKDYRDTLMNNFHAIYPHYSWNTNSGYGTGKHYASLDEFGLTSIHRKSFLTKWLDKGLQTA